jgi:DNA-directed RNA polymerase subunit RPC12/RpoP
VSIRVSSWIVLLLAFSPTVRADTAEDARAEIDRRGIPYEAAALTKAAEEGDADLVRLFLDAGPNADLRDYAWMTPLHNAALWSRAEVVVILLEYGADPDLADSSGDTALHYAARRGWNEFTNEPNEGQPEIVRALVDAGADLDARNEAGQTAMLIAATNGDEATFRLLLERGANTELADAEGNTPLSAATEKVHTTLVRALVESGAPVTTWTRIQYYLYRFARIQAWGMPFFVVFIVVLVYALDSHRPPIPKKDEIANGDGLPRLNPLQCAKCAATVPLNAPNQECPSCGTHFPIPEDYKETIRLRHLATENLTRAIRMWWRARLWNSPPVALFFLLLGPVWLVGTYVGAAGSSGGLPGLMIASTLVGGWTFGAGLFCYGIYLVSERLVVPPLPKARREAARDETSGCTQCGGAVLMPKGALAVACDYCGSDLFRPAFARAARGAAADEKHEAETMFVAAVTALYEMRDVLVSGMFVATFLVVGTALVIVVLGVLEWLKGLVGI